jgi:nucleoside-diphosphate-sugar epimerase
MSPSPKVLLTGVNGFIGSHILDALLAHDISVCGVVRTQKKADQVKSDFPSAGSKLSFAIVPDITAAAAFDAAFKTEPPIDVVIHTASPLSYAAGKTLADFVEPAMRGTMEILEGATRCACNLKRVIITGSFASIADPKDMQGNGKIYTSKDWNPLSTDEKDSENARLAYWTSKTLAERAGMKFLFSPSSNPRLSMSFS